VDHSSVVAFQGLSDAFAPCFRLQKKFQRKISWPKAVMKAAMVMNLWTGWNCARYWTPV
jgi:hypothetical protein